MSKNKTKPTEPGSVAGKLGEDGYIHIEIDGADYLAQDLAFFYMRGRWPRWRVEHIDGDKTNNVWHNLREVVD